MENSLEKTKQKPIRPVLQALGMYKSVEFPLSRTTVVRSTAQLLSTCSDIYFTTKKNKETKMLEVTRIPKPKN